MGGLVAVRFPTPPETLDWGPLDEKKVAWRDISLLSWRVIAFFFYKKNKRAVLGPLPLLSIMAGIRPPPPQPPFIYMGLIYDTVVYTLIYTYILIIE